MSEAGGRNVVGRMALALIGGFLFYSNFSKVAAPKRFSIILYSGSLLAAALGIVYLNDRWKERLARKAGEKGADARPRRGPKF